MNLLSGGCLSSDEKTLANDPTPTSSILYMLFDAFAPSLYGQIIAVVKDPDYAVRILEKTLIYSTRHIHQHHSRVRLHSWLLQVANFKILEEAAVAMIGRELGDDLEWDCYAGAWCRLPADEQEVLYESTFKVIRHEERTTHLELPLDTVQLRTYAALVHFYFLLLDNAA